MNGIYIRDDENFEKALRKFTRIAEKAGVLSELKKYRSYEKPCEEKRRKINIAKRRALRDLRDSPESYEKRSRKK